MRSPFRSAPKAPYRYLASQPRIVLKGTWSTRTSKAANSPATNASTAFFHLRYVVLYWLPSCKLAGIWCANTNAPFDEYEHWRVRAYQRQSSAYDSLLVADLEISPSPALGKLYIPPNVFSTRAVGSA